ncbi:MAG TPA: Na+/H+ antiporter NhaC family protein [Tissierellaceae bacterium]|nr:Na+/H+ antiporter NhaC family protein [Tissierellaceae bacterium]
MGKNNKGNAKGLLPLALFLLMFLGTAAITGDFYKMPVLVAFFIVSGVALAMNKNRSLTENVELFSKGAGHVDIMIMVIIFLLAGAFANVAREMGGVESVVNFGLSIIPTNLLIPGVFLICCFVSLSMGTSMGTIVAIAPIAKGIADKTAITYPIALGAVVSGAMFGDNLSMISDTTIAAVRTQGVDMKDKFKFNFLLVLPAAIATAIIYGIITSGTTLVLDETFEYSFVKILPYLTVLIGALIGFNVMLVLAVGVVFAGVLGIVGGSFDIFGLLQAIQEGMEGMMDLAMIAIVVGGLVELIKDAGGIDWLLNTINSRIKTKKGAEFGIAALTSVADIATANNTIAIVMAGPLAKDIADEYDIDPRRTASLLDIWASVWQGLIPWGGQLLAAAGLAGISPFVIVPFIFYPMGMAVMAILGTVTGFPRFATKEIIEKAE